MWMQATLSCRLGLAERIRLGRNDGTDTAPQEARQKEEANPDEQVLDATVLVIGTAGSGKSATINSLLGREAVTVDAFQGTSNVRPLDPPCSNVACHFLHAYGSATAHLTCVQCFMHAYVPVVAISVFCVCCPQDVEQKACPRAMRALGGCCCLPLLR